MRDIFADVEAINNWLDRKNREMIAPVDDMSRVLKIQEEAGEVAEAFIGMIGQNPRKGQTHSKQEMLNELADVVVTALCAIQHFTNNTSNTREIVERKLSSIITRSPEIRDYVRRQNSIW